MSAVSLVTFALIASLTSCFKIGHSVLPFKVNTSFKGLLQLVPHLDNTKRLLLQSLANCVGIPKIRKLTKLVVPGNSISGCIPPCMRILISALCLLAGLEA